MNLKDKLFLQRLLAIVLWFVLFSFILGTHQTFCILVGFSWCYFNLHAVEVKQTELCNKMKINNNKYSFIGFVRFLDNLFNKALNKKNSFKIHSFIRVLVPTLFFLVVSVLIDLVIAFWMVFIGAMFCEYYYTYGGKIKIIQKLQRMNMPHKIIEILRA